MKKLRASDIPIDPLVLEIYTKTRHSYTFTKHLIVDLSVDWMTYGRTKTTSMSPTIDWRWAPDLIDLRTAASMIELSLKGGKHVILRSCDMERLPSLFVFFNDSTLLPEGYKARVTVNTSSLGYVLGELVMWEGKRRPYEHRVK
jgi:hypothetical protein